MKKLIIFILMFLFLFSYVSAVRVDYSPNDKGIKDMKAVVKDTILWDLIAVGEQGTMELKSHKTPTEIIEVGTGWQVTMIYDTNFGQAHKDILGNVYFYDLKTGEEVEREYKFVYWGTEERERDTYETICEVNSTSKNETESCYSQVNGTETYTYEGWLDYNSKDLPKGQIKLGLMTNVLYKDKIDGVWEVQGKKIEKHAGWTSELSVGLISYYKLDETTGVVLDSLGINNGTNNGATRGVTGKINNAFDFDGSNDYVQIGDGADFKASSYTISLWFKTSDKIFQCLYSKDTGGVGGVYTSVVTNDDGRIIGNAKGGTNAEYTDNNFNNNVFHHVVFVVSGSTTKLYYDGVDRDDGTVGTNTGGDNSNVYLARRDNGVYFDGVIDEVGIWNRSLSSTEVSELYNSGTGITYEESLIINLLSPINYYNSSSSTIDFSANLTDELDLGIANVSLVINDTIEQTNTSGADGVYNFTETLSDGFYEWRVIAYDDTDELYESETRYFTIDTTPFIEFVSPTPANASNLSVPYIPVNVTVTEDYFENVTFYFYKGGVLNETVTFTDDTRFYNKTGCTCDNWEINATVCTTTGKCNSTETRLLIIDILAPEIEILSPVTSYDYLQPNQTIDLNVTVTDASDHLDSVWYYYPIEELYETSNLKGTALWWDFKANTTSESITADSIAYTDLGLNQVSFETGSSTQIARDVGVNPVYENPQECLTKEYYNSASISANTWNDGQDVGKFICLKNDGEYYLLELLNNFGLKSYSFEPQFIEVNGTGFNSTQINYIQDLNSLTVYANDTFGNEGSESVSWATNIILNELNYTESLYETENTSYNINIDYNQSIQTQIKLNYNGTNHSFSNLGSGNFNLNIDIPLVNTTTTYTNKILFISNNSIVHEEEFNQTITPINLALCNGTYTIPALNYTLYDELTQLVINSATNPTTFKSFTEFWLGNGTIKKEYVTNEINKDKRSYAFCILPSNKTYNTNMNIEFSATGYTPRTYALSNAKLTNVSNNVSLYLLNSESAVKFTIEVKKGTNWISDSNIVINKYYLGLNQYIPVSIRTTDASGKFIEYFEIDSKIRFDISQDDVFLGSIEREMLCSATPCEMTLNLEDVSTNPYQLYDETYAENVVYNLKYNSTTKMMTANFLDTTGLATYFRFEVKRTGDELPACDDTIYAPSGSFNCNLTNKDGEYEGTLYVSRSPEKKVDSIFAILSGFVDALGKNGLLIALMMIVIVALVGSWNPAVGIALMSMTILMMGFLNFVAFPQTTIMLILVLSIIIIVRLKS